MLVFLGLHEYIDKDDWSNEAGWATQQHLLYTAFLPTWNMLLVASNRSLSVSIFHVEGDETIKIEPDTEDGCFILLDGAGKNLSIYIIYYICYYFVHRLLFFCNVLF